MTFLRTTLPLCLGLVATLLAGCGGKEPAAAGSTSSSTPAASTAPTAKSAATGPMAADLAATLAKEKEFYVFKTAADLPATLKWENGSDLPEYADPKANKGGTFNYYIQDFPRTTRVIGPDATGGIRQFLWDYVEVYPAVEHPNFPGKVHPGFAKEWASDPATRTVYFRIDERARWSDGQPATTDDVVFTLYLMRSPHIREPWYNDFHTKTWEKVTIYDRQTYALTMREVRPDFLVRASQGTYLFPKHAMADFGPDYLEKYQWRVLPTLGAYTLRAEDIDKGRGVTLTRVKDWWARDLPFWRGRYNPDRIRLTVIRDLDKAFESYVRGDLDFFLPMTSSPKYWYDLLPDTHPDVAAGYLAKARFYNRVPQPDWGLWINRSKPTLDNRDIRLGIQHAANFKRVAEQYYRGDAVQMDTRSDGYSWRMHPTLTARPFDPVKAREYFAKAGYTQQGPDGILQNAAGQRLSFTLSTYRPDIRDVMTILKSEASKAGLELNLEVLDQSTGWKNVQEKSHQIALVALSRTPELFPRYWDFYHGANAYADAYLGADGKPVEKAAQGKANPKPQQPRVQTNNMTMTFIPELDRLIEAYDATTTLDELKPLAAQIEQMVYDDAAWVPGWSLPLYRLSYWRWVRWPEDFNAMISLNALQYFLFSIDPKIKEDVLAKRRRGEKFPPEIKSFEQYKAR
ncbi:ABC transporter substrate-binding protein [Horticoccus sp. 23ND18S-11]|uniref:ABC transporter substrate-binding protein n=1 Tax=Horticoccus sp. 23ND18S-11 TaxID=3391832 RepID=UPI0039C9C72B